MMPFKVQIKSLLVLLLILQLIPWMTDATYVVLVKGRLLQIKKGVAIVKTHSGNIEIPLKKLSEENRKLVMQASAEKKNVRIRLPIEDIASLKSP